jgi:hypothetical protein
MIFLQIASSELVSLFKQNFGSDEGNALMKTIAG